MADPLTCTDLPAGGCSGNWGNDENGINFAHTGFILLCMALVNLMTPGLSFFYGGLVDENSILTMMFQSYISMGVVMILWVVVGFSLCFGDDHVGGWIGSPATYPLFTNVDDHLWPGTDIPGLVFAGYQGMFAVITPALMTGAFAGRVRLLPYIVFISVWLIVVYCPVCFWVWGGGFLGEWGVKDFAGGIVVHTTAGFGALASVFVVGKRSDHSEHHDVEPHNVPFVALGTGLLWFGWFGFNAGSALGATSQAAYAAVATEISAAVALTTWVAIEWLRGGKPGMVGLCVGAVAGLATITPAAGFVRPWAAVVIGFIAAGFCYLCVELKNKMGWDDALDVWGVHGMGGALGTVLLGAVGQVGGVTPSGELVGKQLAAVVLVAVYAFVLSFIILKICDKLPGVGPLKPKAEHIAKGLDGAMHMERAYSFRHTANELENLPHVTKTNEKK